MKSDAYWALFVETGAPVCYLLSRAYRAKETERKRGKRAGEKPPC